VEGVFEIGDRRSDSTVITLARFLILAVLVFSPFTLNGSARNDQSATSCQRLAQALSAYGKVKIGSTRSDLERYFSRDGGFQTPSSTRYVYSKCEYLQVEVEFELAKPDEIVFSANDRVTKISRLYVEYPAKD
jgi:hypothetical protein